MAQFSIFSSGCGGRLAGLRRGLQRLLLCLLQTLHYYRCVFINVYIYISWQWGTLFNCSWRLWASWAIMESYQGPWGHHWRWLGSFSIQHGLDARTAKRLAKCPNSVCHRKQALSSLNQGSKPSHVQAENTSKHIFFNVIYLEMVSVQFPKVNIIP